MAGTRSRHGKAPGAPASPSEQAAGTSNAASVIRRDAAVWLGEIVGFSGGGEVVVAVKGDRKSLVLTARSLLKLTDADLGRNAAVMFSGQEGTDAVVLGLIENDLETLPVKPSVIGGEGGIALELEGDELVLSARRSLEIRCGEASIILRADGKVAIRGTQLVSRSSGTNRIKGGSVQIN